MDQLLGQRFNHQHGGGVTRFQVDRPHRTVGFYECVAIRGVSGSHHFIGSIQAFSRAEIVAKIEAEVEDESLAAAAEGEAALHPRERW